VRHPGLRRAPPVDRHAVVVLLQVREPQHRRHRPADLVEHVHRAGLALPQLLDQHDALLQLRLLLLELLDLLDDAVKPRRLGFGRGDVLVELLRFPGDGQVAPADYEAGEHQHETAREGDFLARLERRLLLLALAFGGKEVDANHRSPALRSASPTATAVDGTTASGLAMPSLPASNVTFWNGLNDSITVPNRSSSAF